MTQASPPVRQASAGPERDPDRTREAILDSAERLFAAKGYEGTSLTEVGAEAGVSRGTPGYFFGAKADLYRAVLDRCFERAREAIHSGKARALASGERPEVVLAGAVAEYFDFITRHGNFVRLMEREALSGGSRLDDALPHVSVVQEAVAAMADELAAAPGEEEPTAHLLMSILSLCWFPLVHTQLVRALGLDPEDARYREARRRHVVDLVLRGARGAERPELATD